MDVLLSIRPEFAAKIFSGEKKFEFRKRKPGETVERVFVYESHPTKRIVGFFSVSKIHSGSPAEIWQRCKESGGILEETYIKYCRGREIIHAFEIDEVVRFDLPIAPFDAITDFTPPQDFVYFERDFVATSLDFLKTMAEMVALFWSPKSTSESMQKSE